MSANLIGFGCDLQQKLDAMQPGLRHARWAGYVAEELYGIAQRLQRLRERIRRGPATEQAERELLEQAREAVTELGFGIEVHRQSGSVGWPMVIVFPGDVPSGSDSHVYFEQGVAVPPRP